MRVITIFAVVIVTYALLLSTGAALKIVDDDWGGADHSTIQAAIDDSSPGETIHVYDGLYSEDLDIDIPVTLSGNGTAAEINALFTAVTAEDNLTLIGFKISGTNAIDVGPDATITDITIELSGSGTAITSGEGCMISDVIVSEGSIDLGPNNSVDSSRFEDSNIEFGGTGSTLTGSVIYNSTITIHSSGNVVYDNIIDLTTVDDTGTNSWNVTPYSDTNIIGGDIVGGNFWYAYDGVDSDEDGIGDDPFEIDGDTSDLAPLMYLPAPPTIENEDVTPRTGTIATTFNFTLTYTDINNDAPTYVRAVFDAMTINLTAADNGEPRNGSLYSAEELLDMGNHSFHFEVSDGTTVVSSDNITVRIVNSIPEVQGSRDPSTGTVETLFNFNLTVRDLDDETPTTVVLDLDGQEYSMQYIGGEGPVSGLNYSITLSLSKGVHQYRFKAIDPHGGINISGNRSFMVLNTPPEILDVSVENEEGLQRFTVSVHDPDGEEPEYARLMIDSKPEPMTLTDSDEDTFEYQKKLFVEEGYHEYYVQVSDDISVDVSDVEPLNLTGFPALKAPGFTPEDPRSEQSIHFSVVYQDRDGRAPSFVRVCIDGNDHQMNLTSGDYTTGAIYSYFTMLPRGVHTYSYNVSNGEYINMTENMTVEVMNTLPYGALNIIPAIPGPDENISLTLSYEDIDEDDPVGVKFWLDGDELDSVKDDLGQGQWVITSSGFVDHGSHVIRVKFADGHGNRTIRRWIPADNVPTFMTYIYNKNGKADVTVNVTATDIDNDDLDVLLVLDGSTYPLSSIDGNETNTTNGMNFTITIPFLEGDNDFDIVVNDTILESTDSFSQTVFIKDNLDPELEQLGHTVGVPEDEITSATPITFKVVYKDPDPEEGISPLVKIVLYRESDERVEGIKLNAVSDDESHSRYEATVFVFEGSWTYHAIAYDGWGGEANTTNRTITIQGDAPIEPVVEEDEPQDYGPLQGLLQALSDTTMLIILMVVVIIIFAAAGAATRGRRQPRPGAGRAQERPAEEPPGYGPPPWEEERTRYPPEPYQPGREYDAGPPREIEFTPETVEFSPGSPPPEEVEEDEDDMEWHKPSPRPSAGPYVPSLGGTDDLDEYQPRHDDEWDALMDNTGFDGAPTRAPSPDQWTAAEESDWDSADGWDAPDKSDQWTDSEPEPPQADDGWGAEPPQTDDGWGTPQEPQDQGWSDDFGSDDGAFNDEHGDADVRHFDGEATEQRGQKKEKPGIGMFDDIEEVDISDWDF